MEEDIAENELLLIGFNALGTATEDDKEDDDDDAIVTKADAVEDNELEEADNNASEDPTLKLASGS